MKRRILINLLRKNGWYLHRNGGNHDIWTNGTVKEVVPRHPNIDEQLAKHIIKKHGLK